MREDEVLQQRRRRTAVVCRKGSGQQRRWAAIREDEGRVGSRVRWQGSIYVYTSCDARWKGKGAWHERWSSGGVPSSEAPSVNDG